MPVKKKSQKEPDKDGVGLSSANLTEILETLSPIEKQVIPHLDLKEISQIVDKSGLDETTVLRALDFLSNKKIIDVKIEKDTFVELDFNGVNYKKNGLPERRLLDFLIENIRQFSLEDAKKQSKLTDNEFMISLGALKSKALIKLENGKISFSGNKEQATKKSMEEKFLEQLPMRLDVLNEEQKYSLDKLKARKGIILISESKQINFEITDIGKKVINNLGKIGSEMLEQLTPEILKKGSWKGKKFRKYDITTKGARIYSGRRQFYLDFVQDIREKLVSLGFQEMQGSLVVNEFWNFDALFQPQFHLAREWTDNYRVANKIKFDEIPKEFIERVKKVHEEKWKYSWSLDQAKNPILRPQGTVLSAQTIASKPFVPGKYFSIARVFRPDVVDATHLSEFNQLEGIIVGKDLNLRHLLGLLKTFAIEIANAEKLRFVPDYYPFTEPSVELDVYKDGRWLELGGAGIFRAEVVNPLMPEAEKENIKVIAWGIGLDRLAMLKYGIKDIRDIFSRKLDLLRDSKIKFDD
ncbi:phenylalanine--tRNA ligase subunit alpha [Candidatus Pacearchaeota archaeon]|nr:phenylalanine--tRNA ligase subunit alpha [Candidatus Pacearchaeota archaeon]